MLSREYKLKRDNDFKKYLSKEDIVEMVLLELSF